MAARLLIALVLLTAALPASTAAESEVGHLVATVGPGFTIDLADAAGTHVDIVTAGSYEILVHDRADIHNFVLGSKSTGERFVDSGVEFVGDKTFTVDLAPGLYGYACSPHFETMHGLLTVVPATPKVRTLRATLTANRPTLSAKRVSPGQYRIVVSDRSARRSFRFVGPGVSRRTGKTFTGTSRWIVRLRAGKYRFGAPPRLSGRLLVSTS
jgi:plastocyanin